VESAGFGQKYVLMTSSLMVLNAYYRRCSKLLLDLGLTATGTIIATGIAPTKRLVAIRVEIVALNRDGSTKLLKSYLAKTKMTTSRRKLAVGGGRRIPIAFGSRLTFHVLIVISTSRISLIGFSK
jgi:hypothetical protein